MPILPSVLALLLTVCAQDAPCLSEIQTLKADLYVSQSTSLAARLEKAQSAAKKAADQQLQKTLAQIQQSFQAEVQKLESQREALEQEFKTALKCETPGFDWQSITCAKKEVKKEPAK